MIIDITYHCSMGCNHCMSSCQPDETHMTKEVLIDALEFHKKHNLQFLTLSGGEIFEHPEIKNFVEIALFHNKVNCKAPLSLLTNGYELTKNDELYEWFLKLYKENKKDIAIQVTNDYRFYPKKFDNKQMFRLNKLDVGVYSLTNYGDGNQCLYPQGRALKNFDGSWWYTKGPKCGNARLLVKQGANSLKGLITTLNSLGKFCTPMIAPDGSIKVGESALCPPVASIYDDENTIIDKIKNFKCTACKIPLERLKEGNPDAYNMLVSE